MSQLIVSPVAAGVGFVDDLVSVTMHATAIVVRPTRKPDALGTRVFTDVVNAATAAGSTVLLHRPEALIAPTVTIDVPAANDAGPIETVRVEPGGIGLLIVRSESAVWTIDFGSDRFVQSDKPVDQVLLAGSDWTEFEAMWITPHFVRALLTNGSYLTGRRTFRHPCPKDIHHDRPAPLPLSHIA